MRNGVTPTILLTSILLLTVTCLSGGDAGRQGGTVPGALDRLLINEGHTRITPVDFAHGLHSDPARLGRPVSCSDCHHTADIERAQIPAPCGSCHPPVALTPVLDESVPHEHPPVPDL